MGIPPILPMIPSFPSGKACAHSSLCLLSLHALAHAEVVVAIRYLQIEGVSHAHLWLFDDAGKPIRQLTAAKTGQDEDPQFSPDGTEIVFMRTEKEQKEFRSISVTGKRRAAPRRSAGMVSDQTAGAV